MRLFGTTLVAAALMAPGAASADSLVAPASGVAVFANGDGHLYWSHYAAGGARLASNVQSPPRDYPPRLGGVKTLDYVSGAVGESGLVYTTCRALRGCDVDRYVFGGRPIRVAGSSRRCNEFASSAAQGVTVFARNGKGCRRGLYRGGSPPIRLSTAVPSATAVQGNRVAFVADRRVGGQLVTELRLQWFGDSQSCVVASVVSQGGQHQIREVEFGGNAVYWAYADFDPDYEANYDPAHDASSAHLARANTCQTGFPATQGLVVSSRAFGVTDLDGFKVDDQGRIYYSTAKGIALADAPPVF